MESIPQWLTTSPTLKDAREKLRHIVITDRHRDHPKPLDGDSFEMGTIRFCNSQGTICINAVDENGKITPRKRPDDVGLYHELLHWLHALIDTQSEQELTQKLETSLISDVELFSTMLYDHELAKLWCRKDTKTQLVSFSPEEFRTIMGYIADIRLKPSALESLVETITHKMQHLTLYGKCNEDKSDELYCSHLSENLYRKCVGQPLRYGHNTVSERHSYYLSSNDVSTPDAHYEQYFQKYGYRKKI